MLKTIRDNKFIILFIVLFLLSDAVLERENPVGTSTLFCKNDFEKIISSEGTNTFDKVFYGNSAVISAFIPDASESGYHNLGIDYGTVSDIEKMLREEYIRIEDDLVLGLNYFTFYDNIDTNPTYLWHRRGYEPYLYFQRDRLHSLITQEVEGLLSDEVGAARYENLERSVYYGVLTGDELEENLHRHRENFWSLPIEDFSCNINALEDLAYFCEEQDINLRVVWMPWNGGVEVPQIVYDVMAEANVVLESHGIDTLDGLNSMPDEYFHDTAHLEYEAGAPFFTQWIDSWLMQ